MPAEFYARKSLAQHEFATQQIPEAYELLYGRQYFQCRPLSCLISREACADNHRRGLNLPCLKCPAGARHAETAPDGLYQSADQGDDSRGLRAAMGRSCIRCKEQQGGRLMAGSFCPACWNRSLEVIAGKNAKGNWPTVTAAALRRIEALITVDPETLADFIANKFSQTKVLRWEVIDDGAALLTGVLASRKELETMLGRILPDATVEDYTERDITPPVKG